MVITVSLALAGAVVAGAQYFVSAQSAPATLASAATQEQNQAWEQSLIDVQAQSGVNLPDTPSPDTVQNFIDSTQSNNLTDSIGRGLLARLATVGVQGLGNDAPTQDSIIAAAQTQLSGSSKVSTPPEVIPIPTSDVSLRAYGNSFMEALGRHPNANSSKTLYIIARATDVRDPSVLDALGAIGQDYRALARDLTQVPVPQTLVPLHKQAVQDLWYVADTFPDLAHVVDDPLRGITAVQKYQTLLSEAARVLTNIAEALNKGGIIFSKDEPGSAWGTFLSAP
jgi:hypothetical protein